MHGELQLSDNAIAELDAVVPNFPGHVRFWSHTFIVNADPAIRSLSDRNAACIYPEYAVPKQLL